MKNRISVFSQYFVLSLIAVFLSACGSDANQSTGSGKDTLVVSGIKPTVLASSILPQTVTVLGAGFQSGLTVQLTTPSGTTSPSASQINATSFQITAVFPSGSYSIAVTNPDGEVSSPFAFVAKYAGVNFAPHVDFATGGTDSGSIALADFNGDGKLDIAVSNFNSKTISVFLNQGNGTFGSPVITTVDPLGAISTGPIVSGDFNEDGKPDLIVATISGGQSDIVLLGNGDGSFKQAAAITNSFGFFQARVADLNGDKHLDLVAGGSGNLTVALGNGDGTFGSAVYLPNGPGTDIYFGIDLGDLTGNKKLDIVGIDYSGYLNAFLGNGDGTFNAPIPQSAIYTAPDSVALADFNGDGKLDALVGYSLGSAVVYPGNGDGSFNFQYPIAGTYLDKGTGSGITVRSADLDQDGKPDALVLGYSAGIFTALLNNGTGTLDGSSYQITIAPGLSDLAVGDLNGDGAPDVAIVNNKTNKISVFLSQPQQ